MQVLPEIAVFSAKHRIWIRAYLTSFSAAFAVRSNSAISRRKPTASAA
jgi:hypothetical protein